MNSISTKTLLKWITLLPMLVLAFVFLLFYNIEFNKERQQRTQHLADAYIRQLLPVAQFALLQTDHQTLQALIDASIVNPEIESLAFFDETGRLLAYRGEKPENLKKLAPATIKNSRHNPYSIRLIEPIRIPQFNLFLINSPFHFQHKQGIQTIGWISMRIDTTPLWVEQYKMGILSTLIILIAAILSFIIQHFLVRRVHRPLLQLSESMKQIIHQHYDVNIPQDGIQEFGVIEKGCLTLQNLYLQTQKEMHQHIETAIKDLQNSHELLEEKNIQLLLDKRLSEEKSKQKSAAIANLGHEIRTPINGIIGFTDLLLESSLKPLEQDYVKTIQDSAKTLLHTLNDILDYSKIDANKLELDLLPLDIRACIDEIFSLSVPKAHKKNLDIVASTHQNVPKIILGDPHRFKQIIRNLVDNAIKFTNHGYVLVQTSIASEHIDHYMICISVTDTGIGISPQEQPLLFQPFQQSKNHHNHISGSGLGLVICKQLIEKMQGKLTLESAVNKGTTLNAYMRFDKLPAYEIEKKQTHAFHGLKVLCFDENPLYLEALCQQLSAFQIHCIPIEHYTKLEKMLIHPPQIDMAFIDITPGKENKLAELIQKNMLPTVLLSKKFIPHYASLGASAFLFKPINIKKLQETLEAMCHKDDLILSKQPTLYPEKSHLIESRKKLSQQHPQILVAEDNPVNRLLFYSWLHEISTLSIVSDGQEALDLATHKTFDLILLDLQMPHLDGISAAQKIHETTLFNHKTPIFLISACSKDMSSLDLNKYGIYQRLEKPINEHDLLKNLLHALSHQTKIIDWDQCIQKMSGNKTLARTLLTEFFDDLKHKKPQLIAAMHAHDYEHIEKIAHQLHGACCFLGLPILKEKLLNLEKSAQENLDILSHAFYQCLEQIDLFSMAFQSSMEDF